MVTITPKLTTTPHKQTKTNSGDSSEDTPPRERPNIGHIVIQYVQGLGGNIKNVCANYGIKMHLKGNKPLDRCKSSLRTRTQRGKRVG